MKIETRVWGQSGRFLDAANTLQNDDNLIIPACVNAAFAIELMIKSILSEEEIFANDYTKAIYPKPVLGHKLTSLFEKIDETYRNDIETLYQNQAGRELSSSLEEYNEYFKSGRYFYEQGSGILCTGVISTANILRKAIESVYDIYAPKIIKASDLGLSLNKSEK